MLSELLNEILLAESVSPDEISDAIDFHKRVIINYEAKEADQANGARVIEVYAYGLTKADNPVIRAYQPYGDTSTKVPSWKYFLTDGIVTWETTDQTFDEPAPGFNPNGDGSMKTIYKIAVFGGTQNLQTNDDATGPILKPDVYKTDTERGMARLKNQVDNPITLSQLQAKTPPQGAEALHQTSGPVLNKAASEKETEVYKTPTERGMERLRQQLDNPQKIDLSQFEKNKDIENLRQKLGDTNDVITVNDLNQKLANNTNADNTDVYKTDTERGLEKLRQQLENPTKIDLSQFERNRRK